MRRWLSAFCFSLICLTSQSMPSNQFDSLVMFGDSLTDNGNLYAYMWGYLPISPPYYEGHFSNGQVWAEYLFQDWYGEQNETGFQDYAVGGAGAIISRKGNLPFSLSVEINDYWYWHTYDKPQSSLYSIWIGANDYMNGPKSVDSTTTSVINSIASAVDNLVSQGANKFIIANIPDMSVTPFTQKYGNVALLKELSEVHNQKLAAKVNALKETYPEVTFIFMDVNALLSSVMAEPERYHLTNVTDPCYLGTYSGWFIPVQTSPELIYSDLKARSAKFDESRWEMIRNNPQLSTAAEFGYIYHQQPSLALTDSLNCYGYLFWDHIHPTTEVHRIIATEAKRLIKEAGLKAVLPERTEDETKQQLSS